MNNIERIEEIWAKLEQKESTQIGVWKIRFSADIILNFFVGLKFPGRQRVVILEVNNDNDPYDARLPELRGVVISRAIKAEQASDIALSVGLNEEVYKDIFSVFVADLISKVSDVVNEKEAAKIFKSNVEKWQSFLEKYQQRGLNSKEQQGLYGELYVLNCFLNSHIASNDFVNTWTGPEGSDHDFQDSLWAIEVKASASIPPDRVVISNEYQLAFYAPVTLYLYHLHLVSRQGEEKTLVKLVNVIRNKLKEDVLLKQVFEERLRSFGYFVHHEHLYNDISYEVDHEAVYIVKDDFPRIVAGSFPEGVHGVEYSIQLSACKNFRLEPSIFVAELISHD